MRFIAGGLVLAYSAGVGATVCSEEIVRNAEAQGFISYIYNCVNNHVTSPGSQACLATFIDANSSNNAFPITGLCRDAYQTLVDDLYVNIDDLTPPTLGAGAIPPFEENIFTMDSEVYIPWSGLYYRPLTGFYSATGLLPFRMCDGGQVRSLALSEPTGFGMVINHEWNNGPWIALLSGLPSCWYCYDLSFDSAILAYSSPSSTIIEACLAADGPTKLCLSTTVIIDAREDFRQCAGYDILVPGPMCSADAVETVQALIPVPYYTFAQCAFHPTTPFCSTTQAYLNEIKAVTRSVDCLACYTEFQSDIQVLAAADINNICGPYVFSDACVAYVASALSSFEICSGFTLNTSSSTAAPVTAAAVGVNAAAASTTTTDTKAYTFSSSIALITVLRIAMIF